MNIITEIKERYYFYKYPMVGRHDLEPIESYRAVYKTLISLLKDDGTI